MPFITCGSCGKQISDKPPACPHCNYEGGELPAPKEEVILETPVVVDEYSKYKMMCPHCGTPGNQKTYTDGHIVVELLLWLSLLWPGFIYSMWRLLTKWKGCPVCRSLMIPTNSPVAQKMIAEFKKSQ